MKKEYPNFERRPFSTLRELVNSAAELLPNKTYLRYKEKVNGEVEIKDVTYSQFNEYINRLGTAFYDLGLKGKNIAVIGETSKEWIATYIATVSGGSVIVPLDKELTENEIGAFLEHAEVSAVVYSDRFHQYFKKLSEDSHISYFIKMGEFDESEERSPVIGE